MEIPLDNKEKFIDEYITLIRQWLEDDLVDNSRRKKDNLMHQAYGIIHSNTVHLLTSCKKYGIHI